MQDLIDVIVAAFISALFASLYRKRMDAKVRLWMTGWFCILVHFASLLAHPVSDLGQSIRSAISLSGLVLCALSFVLSLPESRVNRRQENAILLLLGLPWLSTVAVASLPVNYGLAADICAYLGAVAMAIFGVRLVKLRRSQRRLILLLVVGCAGWLAWYARQADVNVAVEVCLTECFGLTAILLSRFNRKRLSAATMTTSAGAVSWGLVWVGSDLLGRVAPRLTVSPELWNLPKYFVAAGMILTLLEEEIQSAELASEQYKVLFASNPHPMWMYDPETLEFLQANEAAVSHYGYTQQEFRSMNLMEILGDDDAGLKEKSRQTGPQQLSGPWPHRRKNGTKLQVDIASQPVVLNGRRVMFALMHDVTERQRLHAQLLRQAEHDGLTDLPKRELFERRYRRALQQAELRGRKAAILCIDLDRFKQINDTYGHAKGDICLKEVASRLSRLVGESGSIARSGGDEFLVCIDDFANVREAEVFASLALERLLAVVQVRNGDLEMGGSIGLAIYPDDGLDGSQLWRDADAAMYQAKRAGGGQWIRVSDEIAKSANEANEIEVGLRRALRANNFVLYYQPLVGIDGSLHSLEALLRSAEPMLNSIPTDRIIEIAEDSGLIVSLGNWVLEECCRQYREWAEDGIAPTQIALNVSPLQLMRFDFASQVEATLRREQLSASVLEFEVTESTMMPEGGRDVPLQIATLAKLGVRFSVDDFGKGYSSLGRLHELPVDTLKIDQSFTRRIAEPNGTYPTIEAIVALAHTFGMKVVAEGVETEQQHMCLRQLGCDRLQGFLFGRPRPAAETTAYLRTIAPTRNVRVVA